MHELTDATFEAFLASAGKLVVVEFWASWCPPCKMMEPMVEKLAGEYDDYCVFTSVNIDRNPNTAEEYEVTGVPTFFVFAKGHMNAKRLVGAQTKRKLKELIDSVLLKAENT